MEVCLKVAAEHKGMENGVLRDRHSVQACNFRYRTSSSPSPAESPGTSRLGCGLEWKYNALLSFLWPYVLPSQIHRSLRRPKVSELFFFVICSLLYSIIFVARRLSTRNVNWNFVLYRERRKILFNSVPRKVCVL